MSESAHELREKINSDLRLLSKLARARFALAGVAPEGLALFVRYELNNTDWSVSDLQVANGREPLDISLLAEHDVQVNGRSFPDIARDVASALQCLHAGEAGADVSDDGDAIDFTASLSEGRLIDANSFVYEGGYRERRIDVSDFRESPGAEGPRPSH